MPSWTESKNEYLPVEEHPVPKSSSCAAVRAFPDRWLGNLQIDTEPVRPACVDGILLKEAEIPKAGELGDAHVREQIPEVQVHHVVFRIERVSQIVSLTRRGNEIVGEILVERVGLVVDIQHIGERDVAMTAMLAFEIIIDLNFPIGNHINFMNRDRGITQHIV